MHKVPQLAIVAAGLLAVGLMSWPTAAGATSATAAITGGSLAFVSVPGSIGFTATLTGQDQTVTVTEPFNVGDATGSGTGWNISTTSTTFATTSPVHTMSTSATTVQAAPTVACDSGATCTAATNAITYPYTVPAGSTAPTATKIFNATANTGMGDQTVTPTLSLAVPASTYAGSYSSTWTISLVSGP